MKTTILAVPTCLAILLFGAGCSQEESLPPPPKPAKVIKPIIKPMPEKVETSVVTGEKEGETSVTLKEANAEPAAPAEQEKERTEPEKVEAIEQPQKEEKAEEPKAIAARQEKTVLKRVDGFYVVEKGDTLSSISAREDVYGDPLKWPILYRINVNQLRSMVIGEDLPDRPLAEGLKIEIISPEKVKENLQKQLQSPWVVNILSAQTKQKIVPAAARLAKEGYPVYITQAEVKGKDYMRVRIGFYKDRASANEASKKIKAVLNYKKAWITKAGEAELAEFGGY